MYREWKKIEFTEQNCFLIWKQQDYVVVFPGNLFFFGGGGVKQIQLRKNGRENGAWGQ
jgi:hypothetical protein